MSLSVMGFKNKSLDWAELYPIFLTLQSPLHTVDDMTGHQQPVLQRMKHMKVSWYGHFSRHNTVSWSYCKAQRKRKA